MTTPTRANSWLLLIGFPLFGGILSGIAYGVVSRLFIIAEVMPFILGIAAILYAVPNIIIAFVAIIADLRRNSGGIAILLFTSFIAHGWFLSATLGGGSTPLGRIDGVDIAIFTGCGVFATLLLSTFLALPNPATTDEADNETS